MIAHSGVDRKGVTLVMIRRVVLAVWFGVGAFFCLPNVMADEADRLMSTNTFDSAQAAAIAVSGIGFERLKLARPGTLSVSGVEALVDTTTPFVHGELNAKRVWRVNIGGLLFQDSLTMLHDLTAEPHDFTVFVDSTSGIVLRVETRASNFDASEIRRASASLAEGQLTQVAERYVGLPTIAPAISLKEALSRSSIPPELAMEVVADYLVVEYSVGHHKGPRHAWVVNMNGGFSFPADCFPEIACNHYRIVVDAQSGEVLCSTNWPNPPLSE